MTGDEKLAVISGILRESSVDSKNALSVRQGAVFELAMIAVKSENIDDPLDLAKLIIPTEDRWSLALYCLYYSKYRGDSENPFPETESSELPSTVMIPEIARLDDVIDLLNSKGYDLDRRYEDSFSACAEDVEYGHSRYVLMPMFDPAEGRLRSFDKLRDRYGLKIHAVLNVPSESGGNFAYQLCALGFPDRVHHCPTRLSVSAYTSCDIMEYVAGAVYICAKIISAEIDSGEVSRIRAVFDIEELDTPALSALIMYLNAGADLTIDGCYAEL